LPHAIKAPEQVPDAMEEQRPLLAEKISELEAQNEKLVALNVELETENAKLQQEDKERKKTRLD
jgi:peptidoglycan hydrolase CwlO-like protein